MKFTNLQQKEFMPTATTTKPKKKESLDKHEIIVRPGYQPSNKLKDKVAIITGGDSGIGRSIAVLYAKEGADVAIVYHESDGDARETKALVEKEGRTCRL